VALSILAEIVNAVREPTSARTDEPTAPAAATAVDPVCGMTVAAVESSLHLDTAAGRAWFCGTGCRAAYRDNPAAYRQ
jgi:xanthine dehydrogenase accessory factor